MMFTAPGINCHGAKRGLSADDKRDNAASSKGGKFDGVVAGKARAC